MAKKSGSVERGIKEIKTAEPEEASLGSRAHRVFEGETRYLGQIFPEEGKANKKL